MNQSILSQFREAVLQKRDSLKKWLSGDQNFNKYNLNETELVGAKSLLDSHNEVLRNIDQGSFGICTVCREDVELTRLETDYTVCVCIDHYSEEEKRLLERDLELTAKLQRQFLPAEIPTGSDMDISVFTQPAQLISGDYYDFFSHGRNSYGIAVGDVMGKGLISGVLLSHLQASLRIVGNDFYEMDALAAKLNHLFKHNIRLTSFISLFLVRINTDKKIFQYCNAGHNPALFRSNRDSKIIQLKPTGPAIGLTNNPRYKAVTIPYQPGDILLIYTDGISEAGSQTGNEFGDQGIHDCISNNYDKSANEIISGIRSEALKSAGKFDDDATLLVVKFL